MTKDQFIGEYLDKKMKKNKLPYGIVYLLLLDKYADKAEKLWDSKNNLQKEDK